MGKPFARSDSARAARTPRPEMAAENRVRATLTPLLNKRGAWVGQYAIEVAGVALETRYPENRMAKALAMAGITGKLEIYGPSADGKGTIFRITVDIEKHARFRWSEGDMGIRRRPWDELTLAPLMDAASKLSVTLEEAKVGSGQSPLSGKSPNRILERHGARELKP